MLEALNLTKRYNGVTALDSLTLAIPAGEIFCLLGPNGAGKTTTINLFLNFVKPSAGTARINGLDVTQRAVETKRFIAYIPETVMLYGNLTGAENLQYFSALAGSAHHKRGDMVDLLTRVGLSRQEIDRRTAAYSKGMRQKVGIAIALAKNAKALLLDEPTSGLDPKAANEFSALLATLSREGVAVLMATHDLYRAREGGNRIGIMARGRLVHTLATSDVDHPDLETIYLEAVR